MQYGIQAFAKFKRPECTRLHLRELQSLKFSRRNSLEKSAVRSPDGRYCALIATVSLGPIYHKIFRPPLGPPLSKGLDDHPPPPPSLSQGLDPSIKLE